MYFHKNKPTLTTLVRRTTIFTLFGASVAAIPALLSACDNTVSQNKSTTTKTVETPDKTIKTTTTTEKKVEETPKH